MLLSKTNFFFTTGANNTLEPVAILLLGVLTW